MPLKNSVNKPSGMMKRSTHNRLLNRKRSVARKNPTTAVVARPDSTALAEYTGGAAGGVTTHAVSKKRALRDERNKRYAAKRSEQLNIDLAAQDEAMDVDSASRRRAKKAKQPTTLDKVKSALWTVVEDAAASGFVPQGSAEGTTLGVQAF